MIVKNFFKLSAGHIALVGSIVPESHEYIFPSKADLYIDAQKIRTINIIGEDRFAGGNQEVIKGLRSIRTNDDILSQLISNSDKPIKLVIFIKSKID